MFNLNGNIEIIKIKNLKIKKTQDSLPLGSGANGAMGRSVLEKNDQQNVFLDDFHAPKENPERNVIGRGTVDHNSKKPNEQCVRNHISRWWEIFGPDSEGPSSPECANGSQSKRPS